MSNPRSAAPSVEERIASITRRAQIVVSPTGQVTWADVDRWKEALALAARQVERSAGDRLVIVGGEDFDSLVELATANSTVRTVVAGDHAR